LDVFFTGEATLDVFFIGKAILDLFDNDL